MADTYSRKVHDAKPCGTVSSLTECQANAQRAVPHASRPVMQPGMALFIVFVLSVLLALIPAVATGLFYPWPQRYSDIVAGSVGYFGVNKTSEYAATAVFLASSVLFIGCLTYLLNRFRSRYVIIDPGVYGLLVLPLIMAAYYLGAQIVHFEPSFLPIEAVGLAVITLIFYFLLLRIEPGQSVSQQAAGPLCTLFACNLMLLSFGGMAAQFAFGLLAGSHAWSSDFRAMWAYIGVTAILLLGWMALSHDWDEWAQRLIKALYLLQIPLPVLFFVVLPRDVRFEGRVLAQPAPLLRATLILVALTSIVKLYLRFRRYATRLSKTSVHPIRLHLEPWCLIAIPLCLTTSSVTLPALIVDEFHLGEQLLPWQQLTQHLRVPYVDLVPIHGLMALARGALNAAFFDGTAVHYHQVDLLFRGIVAAVTFLTLYRMGGLASAMLSCLMLSCFLNAFWDRFYLMGPVLLILLQSRLLRSPVRWLAYGLTGAVLLVAYNPSVGSASILALSPLFVYQCVRARKVSFGQNRIWWMVIGAVLILLLISIRIDLAFINFLLSNAEINTVANAIKWSGITTSPSANQNVISSSLAYQALKYLFLPTIILLLAIAFWRSVMERRPFWSAGTQLVIVPAITLVFLVPWSMGRIDVEGLSRPGHLSAYVLTVFMPVVLYRFALCRGQVALSLSLCTAFLMGAYTVLTPGTRAAFVPVARTLLPAVEVTSPFIEVDSFRDGIQGIGKGFVEKDRWNSIKALKSSLDKLLVPGSTYLDLTNRQGLYAFFNLRSPTVYSAPYVAAGSKQQKEMLKQLQSDPPHIALVAPALAFDGPASLRTYLLYRHVALRMRICQMGEFTFMIDSTVDHNRCDKGVDERAVLDRVFSLWNIGSLPTSWGRSWNYIGQQFKVTHNLSIGTRLELHDVASKQGVYEMTSTEFDERVYLARYPDIVNAVKLGIVHSGWDHYQRYGKREGRSGVARDPYLIWTISDKQVRPATSDFLLLEIDTDAPDDKMHTVEIRWASSKGWSQPISATVVDGKVLFPLASFPSWLFAENLSQLRLDLGDDIDIKHFKIPSIQLLNYQP